MACAAAEVGGAEGGGPEGGGPEGEGSAGAKDAAAPGHVRATAAEAAEEAQRELASILCVLADSIRSRVGEQHAYDLPGSPRAIHPQLRWLHFHRALSQIAPDGRVLVLESEARRIAEVECSVRSEVQYDAMLAYLCDSGALILSEGAVASSSIAFVVTQIGTLVDFLGRYVSSSSSRRQLHFVPPCGPHTFLFFFFFFQCTGDLRLEPSQSQRAHRG